MNTKVNYESDPVRNYFECVEVVLDVLNGCNKRRYQTVCKAIIAVKGLLNLWQMELLDNSGLYLSSKIVFDGITVKDRTRIVSGALHKARSNALSDLEVDEVVEMLKAVLQEMHLITYAPGKEASFDRKMAANFFGHLLESLDREGELGIGVKQQS